MKKNFESKIQTDGRTYDSKLYTFKELNYREVWQNLDVVVQKLNDNNKWENYSNQNNRAADIYEKILDSNGNELESLSLQQDMAPDYNQ